MQQRKPARIAIIGMAGRFPGARDLEALWENLREGRESISHFTDEELAATEYDFDAVRNEPGYVKARGVLDDVDMFDAGFFGFRPREAESLDPQQRVWFECAWQALEDAGVAPRKYPGKIGVFAGGGYLNTYLLHNICNGRDFIEQLVRLRAVDSFQNIINNDKDFLPTRTSYLFGLTGPSINVQTACSTSLVAVAQAAQSLLVGDSDICLAGGISIQLPQVRGYLTQEGGMESPDGHIHVFDANAGGTVFSNGVGAVVLKRLDDAQRDGDHVLAVLDGYGLNNDGDGKASYIAPSVAGQADVIRQAQKMANYTPESISYIEAHGTGTSMGDPIEVEALSKVFREATDEKQYCGIGSIKSNLGHLDSAAGVAGLIKAVLALRHREIPPTINFEKPNPLIDFENSPFYVTKDSVSLQSVDGPLRAGVSSFGVGGTNVHVVIEEAPTVERKHEPAVSAWQLICFSAKSPEALEQKTADLAQFFGKSTESLADIAYSLQTGREDMPHRRFLIAEDKQDAEQVLSALDPKRMITQKAKDAPEGVVFMFPGQGSQHVNMGRDLYETEAVFRDIVDESAKTLEPLLKLDIRDLLYPAADSEEAAERLKSTDIAQPALFIIEYALARLWMHWGVQPTAVVGHSVGEYAAACIAGIMSVEDALTLIAARGALMQAQPRGDMLAVRASADVLRGLLVAETTLAAANSPELCVASGTPEAILTLANLCESNNIETTLLHTSHAFHSEMMDGALAPFAKVVKKASLSTPKLPFVSSCTGELLTDEQACDADYWTRQMRDPVLFGDCIGALKEQESQLFLEVGPGTALSSFARQCGKRGEVQAVSSLAHPKDERPACVQVLDAAGRLWFNSVSCDSTALCSLQDPKRIPLPGYPFQRKRHWIEPPRAAETAAARGQTLIPQEVQKSATTMTASTEPAASRLPKVREYLLDMISDLSGEDYAEDEQQLSFIELGFDSLFLTQLSTEIQNKLGVKLRFRRMLEDLTTVDALAAFFDENLPADQFAVEQAAPQVSENVEQSLAMPQPSLQLPGQAGSAAAMGQAPADASALERLVQNQLLLMQRQLDLMQTGHSPAVAGSVQAGIAPAVSPSSAVGKAAAAGSESQHDAIEMPEAKPKAFGAQAKIDTSSSNAMDEKQRATFEKFSKRYLAKTKNSKEFTQKNRKAMSDPRVVTGFRPEWKEIVFPLVVDRSKGSKLWDIDGNEYVDLTCGFGSNFLGNQPDFIVEALHRQIDAGYEVGPQHPLTADVTNLIRELTGTERVAFCNTGSEAVMGAMRQARTITGRSLVAIFANSYHGIFDEVIVRGTKKLRSIAAAPGILASAVENVIVLDYDSPKSLEILRERGPELAAIMAEPVQSRNPKLQPREFLHELRKIADENGSALIFDEVITGFRIEPGGAQAYFGVRADLVTYGKIIGGGLPFAAIAGNNKFMDALDGGYWEFGDDSYPEVGVTYFAGTFVRHPLALAAAKASLEYIKEQGPALQRGLNERTRAFVGELNAFFQQSHAAINIDHFGSLCRITVSEEEQFGSLLYYFLRDRGVHIWEGFGCFLTTSHTDEDVRLLIEAFKDSVRELQECGLLSGAIAPVQSPLEDHSNRNPMTEAQREIWTASQMSPRASSAYNESFTLDLHGELDFDKFHNAVDWVNSRHEALRMRFAEDGEYQYLVAPENFPLPLIDLSEKEVEQQERELERVLISHATDAFDLANGPLIRNELYKLAQDKYVMVSTAHHIVFDGWSAGVYIDEIGQAYSALVRSESVNLPSAPSFIDYVRNEIEETSHDVGEAALAYWRKQFSSSVECLELPADRAHPRSKSYEGSSLHWEIKKSTYEAIRKTAATQNSTLYSLMLATYYALLHRLTGQTDIVVGIPSAGQAIVGEYALVGHCVNILPLRAAPLPGDSFAKFLAETGKSVLDAQDHQPATFGSILREANVARIPGRSPLVEVIFNLNRKLPENSLEGLNTSIHEVRKQAINWDMFLNCSEEDGRLTIDCDYNTDILDALTVRKWLAAYEAMLDSISANPALSIRDLPLLESEEKQRIIEFGVGPRVQVPESSVFDLIRLQAEKQPDKVALQSATESLSYSELVGIVEKIGSSLITQGIETGAGVGVCMERSCLLPAVLLGIQAAGGFYVPIDPLLPRSRIEFILDDAALSSLVCDDATAATADEFAGKKLLVDDLLGMKVDKSAAAQLGKTGPEQTAYVIYTSGSTGQPKGVCVPQRALVNLVLSMCRKPGIAEGDRLLAVTTLSFDIAGLELFAPLVAGGTVVMASEEMSEDPDSLQLALQQFEINLMQATPTHWRMLVDNGWSGNGKLRALVGGELFPPELAKSLLGCCAEVWNMYGPTETTIWSTCHRVVDADLGPSVPIGKPIDNTDLFVLDQQLSIVPVGVPGELCIAGAGLASAYWNRPELSADRFIELNLGGKGPVLLYRTGDLVRWNNEGVLECLGRLDDQVKVRGHRIELGEIEAALTRHESVSSAVASRWEPAPGDTRLLAHVRTESNHLADSAELRDYLRASLPEYMIPQYVIEVEDFPRTANGKIDRRALPMPQIGATKQGATALPGSDLEKRIYSIWQDVLNVRDFSIRDDFFDLGGHSILAVKVLTRMRKEFEESLTLKQVFEHPTIEAIASIIESLQLLRATTASGSEQVQGEREEMRF